MRAVTARLARLEATRRERRGTAFEVWLPDEEPGMVWHRRPDGVVENRTEDELDALGVVDLCADDPSYNHIVHDNPGE